MGTVAKRAAGTLAIVGGIVLLRPGTSANRVMHRQLDAAGRRLRYLRGRLKGTSYRLGGGHPDPDVIDTVLADRVRSSLGVLEKHLDVPRIHVMSEDHIVLLHGEVPTVDDANEIERAVAEVSGVAGVESYLHIGLVKSDTRPSTGRATQPSSSAYITLVDAAVEAGASPERAPAVVRAILAAFADRIPEDEREQVATHLPGDVRPLFNPPKRTYLIAPPRTIHEFVGRITTTTTTTTEFPQEQAEVIVANVVHALRTLVPEEADDVAAVLPAELRALWQGEVSETPSGRTRP